MAYAVDPPVAPLGALVTGRARHQPAHRVPHEREILDSHGPLGHKPLEQIGQGQAVLGDVPAGVVAELNRRDAEVAPQAARVGVAPPAGAEPPGELGLPQAVHEQHDAGGAFGEGSGEGVRFQGNRAPCDPHAHRLLEVAAVALERIADQAVERADKGGAGR